MPFRIVVSLRVEEPGHCILRIDQDDDGVVRVYVNDEEHVSVSPNQQWNSERGHRPLIQP